MFCKVGVLVRLEYTCRFCAVVNVWGSVKWGMEGIL